MADAASVPRPPPRDNTGDEESDVSGGSTGTPSKAGNRGRGTKRPRAARTASAGRAPRSHVATEQRRRDRINDGFDQLRDLIPHKDKLDKAAFLQKTIDYICQLQGVLQQLLDMGVVSTLSDDLQWTIRMLLPRQGPGGRPVGTRPDGNPPSALFGPPACAAVSGGNAMSSGGPPLPQMQRQALPQPQPVQQAAPQQAAPGADSAQVQYIQSLLSTMPPAQLHTMVAQAMTGQTQQQQQIHHPAPQQSQAPEPARPIASPWMAQLTSAAPSAAAAAGSMAGAMDPANFQQLAAWISATSQQQQQQQPVQPQQQQQQAWQTQAASQASGDSGGNTNLPSWAHLTQLAQALQQQGTARGSQAAAPSPLSFMRPPANNS